MLAYSNVNLMNFSQIVLIKEYDDFIKNSDHLACLTPISFKFTLIKTTKFSVLLRIVIFNKMIDLDYFRL